MRNFYQTQIEQAASTAGLSTVLVNPEDPSDLALPLPRIDIAWKKEKLTPQGKKLARASTETTRVIRSVIYEVKQPVTVCIMTDDAITLDETARRFLIALPKSFADPHGNVVTCKAQEATWGGFTSELVEVLKTWSKTYHITFTSLITKDKAHAWVKEIDPQITQGKVS
jgi:hypothetical protein